jgi:molybdopterin/thiamine biosynthesis adenylyltransferase
MSPIYLNNKIIFGTQSTSIEIDDESGEIFKLVKLFNGELSIESIYQKTLLSKDDVDELISVLNENLLIEDIELDSTLLSGLDKERYKTNLNYFSNYADLNKSKYVYQKNLINSTVVIIGVGGASLLATSLATMGIGRIILVDYDRIEISNLSRQIPYFESDIGKLKVDVAKEKINSINSSVKVEIFNKKIMCAADLDEIVKDADIVVNGIDTPPIESARWVNYACIKNNKVMIQGGIGSDCIVIEKYSNAKGCYDCCLINSLKQDNEFESQLRVAYSNEFKSVNTSYSPNIIILTGLLAFEIGKYLGKYGDVINSDYTIQINTKTLEVSYINQTSKLSNCPTCGSSKEKSKEPLNIYELIKRAKGIT